MIVDWNGAIEITKKRARIPDKDMTLWPDLAKTIEGNREAIGAIGAWFAQRGLGSKKTNATSSRCLFVHGPSGVGKTWSVRKACEAHGFESVHTYADIRRTPQKLEALFSEVSIKKRGVLVLDDMETFLKETSSVKYILRHVKTNDKRCRTTMVMICNRIDPSFQAISRMSTCVEFGDLSRDEIHRTLNHVSSTVREYCFIPPMDSHFIASHSRSNALQMLNQSHFMYAWTERPPVPKKTRGGKKKKPAANLKAVDPVSKNDMAYKMLFTVYRTTSIQNFVDDRDVLESMGNMNQKFLDTMRVNVHHEYPMYFKDERHERDERDEREEHETMEDFAECIDNLSLADTHRPEMHEDGLYESENSKKWVEDDMHFVVHMCRALLSIRGKTRKEMIIPTRKKKKQRFEYIE